MVLQNFSLAGKTAIVTGCNTGLGQGMALALAQAGADIVGVNVSEPDETKAAVEALGRKFLDLRANLGDISCIPDLVAQAKALTAESTGEQASAGLDRLTEAERAEFTALNDAYKAKFAFPFIMAVKGRTKDEIRSAFRTRLGNDTAAEFATALAEIEKIALLRLRDLLP